MICGLGRGMLFCGTTCYVCLISNTRLIGKNYGYFFSFMSSVGFLDYLLQNYFEIDNIYKIFFMFFVCYYTLTLKNPPNEEDYLKIIGRKKYGNIFYIIKKEKEIMLLGLCAAYTQNLYFWGFIYMNENKFDKEIFILLQLSTAWLGPLMFGSLWDWNNKKINRYMRLICFFGGILTKFGDWYDSIYCYLISYLILCVTAYSFFAFPLSKLVKYS